MVSKEQWSKQQSLEESALEALKVLGERELMVDPHRAAQAIWNSFGGEVAVVDTWYNKQVIGKLAIAVFGKEPDRQVNLKDSLPEVSEYRNVLHLPLSALSNYGDSQVLSSSNETASRRLVGSLETQGKDCTLEIGQNNDEFFRLIDGQGQVALTLTALKGAAVKKRDGTFAFDASFGATYDQTHAAIRNTTQVAQVAGFWLVDNAAMPDVQKALQGGIVLPQPKAQQVNV